MAKYIEQEALLDDITAAENHGGMGAVVAGTLKRYIKRQPAADAAPVRHGHWIDCEDEYSSYVRCSECGDEFTCWEADCAHTNFCPECGAMMYGGANNSECKAL